MSRPLIRIPLELSDPDNTIPIVDLAAAFAAIPGLMSWHTAEPDYMTIDGSNRVSALLDRSGNSRTFTQDTGGVQPLYEAAQINTTRGAIRFDSTRQDRMAWTGTFPITDHTKLIVMKGVGAASATQNILSQSSPADGKHTLFRVASATTIRNAIDDQATPATVIAEDTLADDTWALIIASWSAAAGRASIKINNLSIKSAANVGSAVAGTALYLGGPSSTSGQLNGQVADIAIFSADLLDNANAASLNVAQQYVANRYGLTVV